MTINREYFGEIDNKEISLYTLKNDNGVEIKITNYGCIITAILIPDGLSIKKNIVLGFDSLNEYLSDKYLSEYPYFGATIGRYANRIANGSFNIDGKQFDVTKNHGKHQLHGGLKGFDKAVWKEKDVSNSLILEHNSADGEEGFPGNVKITAKFSLNHSNKFTIEYYAETDAATPLNITNHTYFNLTDNGNALNHNLFINADKITETDDELIPTGKYIDVADTEYDFRKTHPVKEKISDLPVGYDVNYVLNKTEKAAAIFSAPNTSRKVKLYTTKPGLQFYTGFFIPEISGKFGRYSGLALEPQYFPDSPNNPNFPNCILSPEEEYYAKTVFELIF
ncbi:MAG: aldose epimerase family protein [Bacteroidota bacterium]|nr:aldose epimerase family protein [Bacteroidota bacterium]